MLNKAVRIINKGARRFAEATSHRRLLQTKVDCLSAESDVSQLYATIEEKEEAVDKARVGEQVYKNKFLKSEVSTCY